MSDREVADKHLSCSSCGDGFVFSEGEQELFRLRGITSDPAQCPRCARGRLLVTPYRGSSEHSA